LLICNAHKRILFASPLYQGRVHDFTIFKELLGQFDFSGLTIHVDLGFLGIEKMIIGGQVFIPHKASKNHSLTPEEKAANTALARLRVVVENAVAKIKSFFVLRIENRMKKKQKLDEAFEICAGLANFKTCFLKHADN
jgi:hypothetical protein